MFLFYNLVSHTGHLKHGAKPNKGFIGKNWMSLAPGRISMISNLNATHSDQGQCFTTSTSTKGFRSNDNLADLLSRIRNGYFRSFEDITVIDCKQTRELLDAFIYAGYIHS